MSTFLWIDHSEKQRRQMMEAIDAFRESDTRDELGLAGIRDTFSDLLFPGTGAAQSRARYFFFVPWMYQAFESKRFPGGEFERRGRVYELALIDRLAESPDPTGTIGIRARATLQRLPSSIYWNGLRTLELLKLSGTQWEFHRTVDRRRAEAGSARTNDDGEVSGGGARAWHCGIPPAPKSFPNEAEFALTRDEAGYLRGRILETQRASLFASMLDRPFVDQDVAFAWDHSVGAAAAGPLGGIIYHARCFSAAFNGAAILYNLLLAELEPVRREVLDLRSPMWSEWAVRLEQERSRLADWNLAEFWLLLAKANYQPSEKTRKFVEAWAALVKGGPAERLRHDAGARALIFNREKGIKGKLARCDSPRAREKWRGDAGLGRMDYRWGTARTMLCDIATGLEAGRA